MADKSYSEEEKQRARYLGKYLICFYNENEELVRVYLNPWEMAEDLHITYKQCLTRLANMRKKHYNCFIKKEHCHLVLIKDDD